MYFDQVGKKKKSKCSVDLEKEPSGMFPACSFCKGGSGERLLLFAAFAEGQFSVGAKDTHRHTHTPTTEQPKTTHTLTHAHSHKKRKSSRTFIERATRPRKIVWLGTLAGRRT